MSFLELKPKFSLKFHLVTSIFYPLTGKKEKILWMNYFMQVDIFTEEIIRAGSAAALSLLLNRLDPVLRKTANLGRFVNYPWLFKTDC